MDVKNQDYENKKCSKEINNCIFEIRGHDGIFITEIHNDDGIFITELNDQVVPNDINKV